MLDHELPKVLQVPKKKFMRRVQSVTSVSTASATARLCYECYQPLGEWKSLPIVDVELHILKNRDTVSEFGEPLCEWVTTPHYLIEMTANCPHCGKPFPHSERRTNDKDEADRIVAGFKSGELK